MYESRAPLSISDDEARLQYKFFLRDLPRFESALKRILAEWPISCEQFLSNEHINRIAWLGQSSMCIETRIPACFRGGFRMLELGEQNTANTMALKYLNIWLRSQGEKESDKKLDIDDEYDDAVTLPVDNAAGTIQRINHYIENWMECGYEEGIPDEVPIKLMRELLAPSYKAICLAILKNDLLLKSLGFGARPSKYYGVLKRIEVEARPKAFDQMRLF